jgi:hypothetical protein
MYINFLNEKYHVQKDNQKSDKESAYYSTPVEIWCGTDTIVTVVFTFVFHINFQFHERKILCVLLLFLHLLLLLCFLF